MTEIMNPKILNGLILLNKRKIKEKDVIGKNL